MDVKLIQATVDDAELIWRMKKEAFAELLAKYQDMETNPGNEPLEKDIYRLQQDFTYYYLIQFENEYVGAIRIVDKEENEKKTISPFFVLPKYRNRGIAQQTLKLVEQIHGAQNWLLDTIMQEEGNCHLYEKMGYHRTGEMKEVSDIMTLIVFEK